MNILKAYDIPWKGLSNGFHHFDFEVDDRFFTAFDDSEIKGGRLKIDIDIDKSATILVLDVYIDGTVTVECDRCLGDVELPVEYDNVLQVKFSAEIDDYDDDIMWINPADGELPMAQYIYESIILSLPYQKVHGTDESGNMLCDKDMVSRFKIITQEELDTMDNSDTQILGDTPISNTLAELKSKMEKE